ncbi:unnamed protein product [Adineta steineri]|uniref:Uncharacterized protein n=1 Tax=Adineta steineri TaxID=433720 RepID=A0A819ZYJ9_9BILA|nr:unnamed protein product [Adineta steineri]CAF4176857.1 unnamed protein product [Adineta steineri]
MASRQYSDWLSNPISTTHGSQSSVEPIVWADDDDNDGIDSRKTSFAWYWCCKCCIIGSLLAGIGLAIIITFWLTSKTAATETLTWTTVTTTTATTATTTTSTTSTSSTSSTSSTTSTTSTTSTSSTSATSTTSTTATTSTTPTTSSTSSTTSTTTSKTTSTTSSSTSTTSTTSTTATTTPSCGTYVYNPPGQILSLSAKTATTNYTLYTYGFMANHTLATLSFIITGEGGGGPGHYWLLDEVSVNHTNANANVLINGDFETGNLNGWTQYCNTSANCDYKSTGYYAHTITSPCYAGTYCIYDACKDTDYLEQSFSTVAGDYYFISYYIRIEPDTYGPWQIYVTLT